MPILFRTPLSTYRKGSQHLDFSFLLQRAPIPSLPSLYTAGAFILLKSPFPYLGSPALLLPSPLFHAGPPSCSKPPLPASNWDPILKLGVPGARNVARPHLGTCGRGGHSVLAWTPLPLHSTQPRVVQPLAGPLHSNFLGRRKSGRQQAAKINEGSGGAERCPAGSQDPPSTCSSRIAEKQRHRAPMAGRADAKQTRSSGAVGAVGQGPVRPSWSRAELPKSSPPHRCSRLH